MNCADTTEQTVTFFRRLTPRHKHLKSCDMLRHRLEHRKSLTK